MRPGEPAAMARYFAMGAVTAVLSWVSIRFTREPGGTSMLWIASGVLTGVLLTSRRRLWPGYLAAALVGNILARIVVGDSWLAALGLATAALIDAVPVAWALRTRVGNVTDPSKIKAAGRVAFASTLAACLVSGLIAAPLLMMFRSTSFGWAWGMWFVVHTIGMVLFATLTTVALSLKGSRLSHFPERRRELVLILLLIGVICVGVFGQTKAPILFLLFPPLLLAAFRHRIVGVVLATALVSISAIVATLAEEGPFQLMAEGGATGRLLLLQAFIACLCLTTFPILTVLTERRYLARRLRENQQQLRAITDNVPAFILRVDTTGHYTFVNAQVGKLFGEDPQALVGRTVREIAGEVYERVKPFGEAALGGETVSYELERDVQGRHYVLQSTYIPDRDDAGRINGYYVLSYDITRLKELERALSELARHDSLTGLPNRRHFEEHFDEVLARQRRSKRPLVLIYLDVDHFKQVNDTLGHVVGDQVLKSFGERLKAALYDTDFVARLGGDEFVVLIENVDTDEFLPLIGAKLLAAFDTSMTTERGQLRVTASIGIAHCRKTTHSQAEVLKLADRALYEAKAAGRNTWRMATDSGGD